MHQIVADGEVVDLTDNGLGEVSLRADALGLHAAQQSLHLRTCDLRKRQRTKNGSNMQLNPLPLPFQHSGPFALALRFPFTRCARVEVGVSQIFEGLGRFLDLGSRRPTLHRWITAKRDISLQLRCTHPRILETDCRS